MALLGRCGYSSALAGLVMINVAEVGLLILVASQLVSESVGG